MIKTIVQTKKKCYVIDDDVLWVEIFYNGIKQYGHTADNVRIGPKTKNEHQPITNTAKKRMELDPIDEWTKFCLDRVQAFWKGFLG